MKSFNDFKSQINEVLKKSDPIEKWISDFVHSTNPKFAGKSNAERIEMAKGAYYGAQKNEDAAASQNSTPVADMNEDQYTSEYKIKSYVDPITGENKTRKIRPHRINFDASKMHSEPAQQDAPGDYGIKESYDDKVDRKKVLNPPIPLTQKKKTVKDFLKKEEVQVEAKVYDPLTKKMVATKPIKVQAGGGATKNGVPVETGPSKYKNKLPMSKAAAVLAAEEVELDESAGLPHALMQVGKDKWHIYDTKTQKVHSTYNNKNVAMKKYGELNDKHAGYETAGGIVKGKYGVRKEEVQIDEVSKSTLMRYIPKASRDAAQRVYTGKEAQAWAGHHMRAGDYAASDRQLATSKSELGKSIKRLKGIDTATKKLGTQKEEVEESRAHKTLATFFKNREVAQRAFTGQNKPPAYSEKGIETPKPEKKDIKEGIADHKGMAQHLMKMHDNKVTMNHIEDLIGDSDEPHKIDKDEIMNHVTDLRSKHVKEGEVYDDTWKQYKGKSFSNKNIVAAVKKSKENK